MMDNKAVIKACIVLRDALRADPKLHTLELAVSPDIVMLNTIDVDGEKQTHLIMGKETAEAYLVPANTDKSAH